MPLAVLFAIFALFGLFAALIELAAKSNSVAPSMYRTSGVGWIIFIVCGLISLACLATFHGAAS